MLTRPCGTGPVAVIDTATFRFTYFLETEDIT